MAKVTLPMGIERISGRVGNVCFRTMKTTGKVYMSGLPRARQRALSKEEKAARERFAHKARLVRAMRQEGSKLTHKQLWELAGKVL